MGKITHIFFDLHNTLVDSKRMHPCWSAALGRLMAERYGSSPDVWAEANRRIVADWDSYYADLDLDGEDGMAHFWEGLYRTTRALFRLVGVPEPDHAELKELVKTVPAHAPRNCDALYDDVRPVINSLHNSGYVLGIISHALVEQARATLQGGRIIHYFQGPIIGPDSIGRLCKDRVFLEYAARKAQIPPSQCLVVDDDPVVISSAGEAGMFTVQVCRHTSIGVNQNTDHTCTELRGLLEYLRIKV